MRLQISNLNSAGVRGARPLSAPTWRSPAAQAGYGAKRDLVAYYATLLGMFTVPFTAVGMGPLNLSDVFCLLSIALLASCGRWLQLGVKRSRLVVIGGTMICFGSLLAVGVAHQASDIWTPLKYFVAGLAMFPVLCVIARTSKRWDTLAAAFVLGVVVNCVFAVLQVVDRAQFNAVCITQGRGCGFTDHPNDLGYLIAVGVLFTVALLCRPFTLRPRLLLLGALAVEFAGLAATGSVGSAIGTAAGLLVFGAGAFLLRPQKVAPAAVIIMVALIAGFPAIDMALGRTVVGQRVHNMMSASSVQDTTLGERFQGYEAALEQIRLHPLVGVGTFHSTGNGTAPHNIFIGLWYEAGMLGLLGVVLILVAVLRSTTAATIAGARMNGYGLAALACLGALLAAIVCSQVAPFFYRRAAWAPLWLAFAFAQAVTVAVAAHRQRSAQRG